MRLRNIPGSKEEILHYPYVITDPLSMKGRWASLYAGGGKDENAGEDHPLMLEIGMGKGRFLRDMALLHPENRYLGMEMYSSVLLRAIQRRERSIAEAGGKDPFLNLFYMRLDAREMTDIFDPGEVSRIYLNFSDPWPKARHADRRLTSGRFLARYRQILLPGSQVEFKTDNRALFDFSLEEAGREGWEILVCTFDLHHDENLVRGNVMTEYEEKFSSQGLPICKMVIAAP